MSASAGSVNSINSVNISSKVSSSSTTDKSGSDLVFADVLSKVSQTQNGPDTPPSGAIPFHSIVDVLDNAVANGTISQDQRKKLLDTFFAEKPQQAHKHHHHHHHVHQKPEAAASDDSTTSTTTDPAVQTIEATTLAALNAQQITPSAETSL